MFEPVEEGGFEDTAAAVKRVAREPHQLRLAESQLTGGFELLAKLRNANDFAKADRGSAIDEREGGAGAGKVLPDELEHQQLVEVSIEQGARDGIHLPVVIVGASGEIDNHNVATLIELDGDLKRRFGKDYI